MFLTEGLLAEYCSKGTLLLRLSGTWVGTVAVAHSVLLLLFRKLHLHLQPQRQNLRL